MNRKQKLILSITSVILVLLIIVGLTYAYFLTRIIGNSENKSVTVTTAKLRIRYGDGNGIITAELVTPETTLNKKTFTVTNEGNMDSSYVVVIDNVSILDLETEPGTPTTFESNDFVYTLSCKQYNSSNVETGTCNGVSEEETFPLTNNSVLVSNNIPKNMKQEYELIIKYKDTDINQSNDMNKKLEAKVDIKNMSIINPYGDKPNTLAYNIITNALTKKNGTEFREIPLTNPGQSSSLVDERELSITSDNDGASYYYRGNVTDNYVNYSGMCWRIVRIKGDGSTKLILEDKDNECNSQSYSGIWYYSKVNESTISNGFKTDLENIYSTIQTKIENPTDIVNPNECYETTVDSNVDSPMTVYENLLRLNPEWAGYNTIVTPTLMCNNTLTYNGLSSLTADEAVFSGLSFNVSEGNYLVDIGNDSHYRFWYITPAFTNPEGGNSFMFNENSELGYHIYYTSGQNYLRPTLTLKSGIKISGGEGTKANPYIIRK